MVDQPTSGTTTLMREQLRPGFGGFRREEIARLEGVDYSYPSGTLALQGIDISFHAGEFISFVGPSGCGKSTILRLLSGLSAPTTGRLLASYDWTGRGQQPVSIVFQDATLLPWRSALANVALPLELNGWRKKAREGKARDALAMVGLSGREQDLPNQLSGGMRMRVAIARALVGSPDLLLMDEPFGALDEITRQRLQDELIRIWEKAGCTIVFVTHSVSEAAFLSGRIAVMSPRPGRIERVIDIDLGDRRNQDFRLTPAFNQVIGEVSSVLHSGGGDLE